jgi:hypothetical protein
MIVPGARLCYDVGGESFESGMMALPFPVRVL